MKQGPKYVYFIVNKDGELRSYEITAAGARLAALYRERWYPGLACRVERYVRDDSAPKKTAKKKGGK